LSVLGRESVRLTSKSSRNFILLSGKSLIQQFLTQACSFPLPLPLPPLLCEVFHVIETFLKYLAPTLETLLEIAKVPSLTPQGFINFEKRRDIYLTGQQFTKSQFEPSTVKESKEALQQTLCMLREPLNKELFGRVKAKAIVSFSFFFFFLLFFHSFKVLNQLYSSSFFFFFLLFLTLERE
jgi:hypothetical protein